MRRRRDILGVLGILWFLIPCAMAAEVLTNDAIIRMAKAGLADELIVDKIKISQGQFALSTEDILHLKKEGVSDFVLKAMIRAVAPSAPVEPRSAEAVDQKTQAAVSLYRQGKCAEAAAAFDRLLAERPDDNDLKVWKALALLEQARAMKDANASGYKPLVVSAYTILQPLGRQIPKNPDWNFAMAKAFWLNDRPTWGRRAAEKAVEYRKDFPEAQLLLGDLAYDQIMGAPVTDPRDDPSGEKARMRGAPGPRKAYETVLSLPDLSGTLRAEAFYKLGLVAADLENKKAAGREYWERAAAADPDSRYGQMAQAKLAASQPK